MIHGTELIMGHTYFSKTAAGAIMPFTITGRSNGNTDIWYDGGVARNIKDIEYTKEQAAFIDVDEIKQGNKTFVRSRHRNNFWIWINKPLNAKSFDYYMCGCGRIISNCGFAIKHKCKVPNDHPAGE